MKKRISEQQVRDWYENHRVPPSNLIDGKHFNGEDMDSLFSYSILNEWRAVDYKHYRIHWEGQPLISLINELKTNKD